MAKLILHPQRSGNGNLPIAIEATPGARIGRDAECEVPLLDIKASRHHATLVEGAEGEWRIVDQASKHGLFVNGKRLEDTPLTSGDVIQIGETLLEFREGVNTAEIVATPSVGPLADRRRLRVFYDLADAARALGDRNLLLEQALRGVMRAVRAERGLIAIPSKEGGPLRRISEIDGEKIVISRQIVQSVSIRGESVLMKEHTARPVASTLQAQGVRAALAAPLRAGPNGLGMIYVDSVVENAGFSEHDLTLITALATMAGAILDAATKFDRAVVLAEVAERATPPPTILGGSAAILDVRRDIEKLASADIAIHIRGESGVGKELVARSTHLLSDRHAAPMVAVNCAAIPDNLIESELFGYARGAFTGATTARRGKFELADGGTLFLDEVGDLSPTAQAKILRVLEDGKVQAIGSERDIHVDVRVVSASHKDLRALVAQGIFREDLFYRLVVAEIEVPPLRQRESDVQILAKHFLSAIAARTGKSLEFSPPAEGALGDHSWPGNVRELRNVVERAAALATGPSITIENLRLRPHTGTPKLSIPENLAEQFAQLTVTERELVERALADAKGNVSAAARSLGITRIVMKRRIERYNLIAETDR